MNWILSGRTRVSSNKVPFKKMGTAVRRNRGGSHAANYERAKTTPKVFGLCPFFGDFILSPLYLLQKLKALRDLLHRCWGLVLYEVVLHSSFLGRLKNGGPIHLTSAERDVVADV